MLTHVWRSEGKLAWGCLSPSTIWVLAASIFLSSQPLVLRQFITQCQTSRTEAVLSSSIGIKGESRLCYLPLLLWQDSISSDLPEELELRAHSTVPAWEGAISSNAF